MSEIKSEADIAFAQEFTARLVEDVDTLLGRRIEFVFPLQEKTENYWRRVRTACELSQGASPDRLRQLQQDEMSTEFGRTVLRAFSLPGFQHTGSYPGAICAASEEYYYHSLRWHGAKTVVPTVPLVINDGTEIVGLMKFNRVPTVLGFIDNQPLGLYPGVISTPVDKRVSAALEDVVKETNTPTAIDLDGISPNVFGGLRVSSFALDCGAIATFRTLLRKDILDLDGIKTKTAEVLGSSTVVPNERVRKYLWERGASTN